ncbi:MAG: GNAT family N-acetyltransferase [Oscillospiraceae bacterium]|nr:GNAT family N-acetyltransferase [Oscillospiraceae bacterium]
MKIERVYEEDAAKLLEIYAPYVKETAVSFEYTVPSVEEFSERIRKISARYPYIKAVDNKGEILGYAYAGTFKTRCAYNWSVETTIYVRKNYRQSGIGRVLYEILEKSLQAMGVLNLNACIAYTPDPDEHLTNDSMLFHQKLGYELVGTFHKCGYKFNKWYDMIWMEKMIGKHSTNQPDVRFGEWTI